MKMKLLGISALTMPTVLALASLHQLENSVILVPHVGMWLVGAGAWALGAITVLSYGKRE